jgi:hypothetical protein
MHRALTEILESTTFRNTEEDVLTFSEYLDLVKREPWTTRNTFQLLHDMLLSSGVERTIVPGQPLASLRLFQGCDLGHAWSSASRRRKRT